MAYAEITPVKMAFNKKYDLNLPSADNGAVNSTSKGALVPLDKDEKTLIIVKNTADSGSDITVTVKAGNGIQGVSGYDIAYDALGFGESVMYVLESGRYKNIAGDNKGSVLIIASAATCAVSAIVLP